MCGIAGFHEHTARSPDVLRAMVASIRHRGPDAEGTHESGSVHLGHRRLSVVDLAASRQPMFSEDRSLVVVYNG